MVNIIGNNVLHCAKISNNRVRMYIKSREIAENFISSGGQIEINRKTIQGRWYKQERNDKKVIISNVPPHVPHSEITKLIVAHGIIPSSDMRFMRLTQEEGLVNILSERRFIYIPIEESEKLPSSEVVKYEDDEYRVFYNDAQIKCFICHQFGHTTQTCEYAYKPEDLQNKSDSTTHPSSQETTIITDITDHIEDDQLSINNTDVPNIQAENIVERNPVEEMEVIPTAIKRPLSTSTQSNDDQESNQSTLSTKEIKAVKQKKQPKKKAKLLNNDTKNSNPDPLSINQLLESIEENYEKNKKDYPISFANFKLLMDMVKGHKDPILNVTQLTDDIDGVIKILSENYKLLKHRSMKIRFTKLRRKLLNKTSEDSNSSGSELSEIEAENETNKSVA